MKLLNIKQGAGVASKAIQKNMDLVVKFEPFLFRKANMLVRKMPPETNEGGYGQESGVTLFFVPRDT